MSGMPGRSNAKIYVDKSSHGVSAVKLEPSAKWSLLDTSWTVFLRGGPMDGRMMVLDSKNGGDICFPIMQSSPFALSEDEAFPLTSTIETARYDRITGEYLAPKPKETASPADKSAQQTSGGAMTTGLMNAVGSTGMARLTLPDGSTLDGYVTDFESRIDSYDMTAFGDSSKSYVAGTPSYSVRFEGTTYTQNPYAALTPNAKKAITYKEEQKFMQLFEYAVVYEPRDDNGKVIHKDVKVLTAITSTLARSHEAVQKKAIQDIAAQTTDLDLDFVRVITRPFNY